MPFDRSIASKGLIRLKLVVNENGLRDHDYGHGAQLSIRQGWNDDCEMVQHNLSVEDLRDLQHLCDRALAAANAELLREVRNRHEVALLFPNL